MELRSSLERCVPENVHVEYRNDTGSFEWICTLESLMSLGITIKYIHSIPYIFIPPGEEERYKETEAKTPCG